MPDQYTARPPALRGVTDTAYYQAQATAARLHDALAVKARLETVERYAAVTAPGEERARAAVHALRELPDAITEFEATVDAKLPVLRWRVDKFTVGL